MIERKVKSVRALERGLDVLLEIHRSRAASLRELHHSTGLPKATLLRMLLTLSKRGLVWQRLADGAFLPSRLHRAMDWHADSHATLAELASPHLAELSRRVAWPSILAVPRLDHVEIVETNSAMNRLDSAVLGPIGFKLSYIHTATGRAYLSACGEDERASDPRPAEARRRRASESVAAIERIVRDTQARGYSERDPPHPWPDRNRSEVVTDGRRSIAVAVMVHGHAVGAINIAWPGHRMQVKDVVAQHLKTLQATAAAVGRDVESHLGESADDEGSRRVMGRFRNGAAGPRGLTRRFIEIVCYTNDNRREEAGQRVSRRRHGRPRISRRSCAGIAGRKGAAADPERCPGGVRPCPRRRRADHRRGAEPVARRGAWRRHLLPRFQARAGGRPVIKLCRAEACQARGVDADRAVVRGRRADRGRDRLLPRPVRQRPVGDGRRAGLRAARRGVGAAG